MVTTLICPKIYAGADLKAHYKQRWNIELDIRDIKETMGMNVVSCKTPEMVIKEIWVGAGTGVDLALIPFRPMIGLVVMINPKERYTSPCWGADRITR